MSQTLYRKYRSQRFAEIIGQQPVVRILRNSIRRERINHAYLFSGPRGTGKTSIARIFAKALNCLNPQDGDACGVCAVCTSVAGGNAVDVIEIDAASNRGIDDIRDLRERVNYAPLEMRHKVYIIDEVHMITGPAWNALLKTLEEPPAHVIFCLCTTEANKVPMTILSRCIRFDFQRLPLDALAEHLEHIATVEGFALSHDNALRLAHLAEGSARDAISLLDQLTVYCESEITGRDIEELFQLGDVAQVTQVVGALVDGDAELALATWNSLLNRGVDSGTFLLQLADELRQRYLASPEPRFSRALEVAWEGLNLLKYDSFPALLVELTLLQAADALRWEAHSPPVRPHPAPAEHRHEKPVEVQARPAAPKPEPLAAVPETASASPPVITAAPPSMPMPAPSAGELAGADWEQFAQAVHKLRVTTFSLVRQGVSGRLDTGRLVLSFTPAQRQAYTYARQPDNLAILSQAARGLYGPEVDLVLEEQGAEPAGPAAEPNGGSIAEPLLAQLTEPALNGNASSPGETAERKPTADDVMRLFEAEEI